MMQSFYHHTQAWISGELLESALILAFVIVVAVCAGLFWKFGTNASAKSLVIPLLIIAVIFLVVSASLYFANSKREKEFPQLFAQDQQAFILVEKQRIEDFQYQYQISKIVATICFLLTIAIFWLSKNPTWLGIALALSIFGLSGLVIDYFSEERAKIYYTEILQTLAPQSGSHT